MNVSRPARRGKHDLPAADLERGPVRVITASR